MRVKRVLKKNNGSSDPRSSLRRDMNGKIAQWKSDTRDGFELNLYVENGCCEGLKAKGVMDKYPQFQEYAYATLMEPSKTQEKNITMQLDPGPMKQVSCFFNSYNLVLTFLI